MTANPQPFSPALRELERMGVNWRFINTDTRTGALTAFWVEEDEDLNVFTKKKAIAKELAKYL